MYLLRQGNKIFHSIILLQVFYLINVQSVYDYHIDYRGYHKELGHINRWLNSLCTHRDVTLQCWYQILIRKFYKSTSFEKLCNIITLLDLKWCNCYMYKLHINCYVSPVAVRDKNTTRIYSPVITIISPVITIIWKHIHVSYNNLNDNLSFTSMVDKDSFPWSILN